MNDFSFAHSKLTYKNPLSVRGTYIVENDFLIVQSGEAKKLFLSTLWGFHESNIHEVAFMLKNLLPKADFSQKIDYSLPGLGLIDSSLILNFSDELLFYLENALYFFKTNEVFHIKNNGLLSLKNQLLSSDADVIKIKFHANENNSTSREQLKEKMAQLLKYNPNLKFRIDANRSFELSDLLELQNDLLKVIAVDHFDYFEEPLKNSNDLVDYLKLSKISYALDESFIYSPAWCLKYFSHLPIVLKPSLLSISKCFSYLKNYPQTRFIISSSYEHSTALQALKFLANERANEFHGLTSFVNEN